MINATISKRIFPSNAKLAFVMPIYKNGSRPYVFNYRPLSVISAFSKVIEKHIARAVGMLSKVRHYVQESELKNIYHAIFESHLRYRWQVRFLSSSKAIKNKIEKLQKKALRIISFSDLQDSFSSV